MEMLLLGAPFASGTCSSSIKSIPSSSAFLSVLRMVSTSPASSSISSLLSFSIRKCLSSKRKREWEPAIFSSKTSFSFTYCQAELLSSSTVFFPRSSPFLSTEISSSPDASSGMVKRRVMALAAFLTVKRTEESDLVNCT